MVPKKRKESRRAVVVKIERDEVKDRERERDEERERRGKEEGRGCSRYRRHHSELLPPPKLLLSASCLVAIAPSLLENRERERKNDGKRRTKGCPVFTRIPNFSFE
ncbi:hypothetical protein PIB30_054799 [Stylosanthes scabra]|uniref:Uncharacterized protein n=1 Tax=Stylosanthes scabra TaxID=79078 RepID=A0ABU6UHM7_9FABA|nr:hypothetical protein [Stylosanthes scabra]